MRADWRDYLPPSAGGWNPDRAQHARHLAHVQPPDPAAPQRFGAPARMDGAAPAEQQLLSGSQEEERVMVGEAMGRILYVRDSEDGAASDGGLLDSDEDPDDDLDI